MSATGWVKCRKRLPGKTFGFSGIIFL